MLSHELGTQPGIDDKRDVAANAKQSGLPQVRARLMRFKMVLKRTLGLLGNAKPLLQLAGRMWRCG